VFFLIRRADASGLAERCGAECYATLSAFSDAFQALENVVPIIEFAQGFCELGWRRRERSPAAEFGELGFVDSRAFFGIGRLGDYQKESDGPELWRLRVQRFMDIYFYSRGMDHHLVR